MLIHIQTLKFISIIRVLFESFHRWSRMNRVFYQVQIIFSPTKVIDNASIDFGMPYQTCCCRSCFGTSQISLFGSTRTPTFLMESFCSWSAWDSSQPLKRYYYWPQSINSWSPPKKFASHIYVFQTYKINLIQQSWLKKLFSPSDRPWSTPESSPQESGFIIYHQSHPIEYSCSRFGLSWL